MIRLKRIYERATSDDGWRVLVDRLWPRGLAKSKAKVDLWMKEIAPSDELRKWFGHDPERWPEFQKRYRLELARKKGLLAELMQLAKKHGTVTLLFAAKDEERNQAVVLLREVKDKR
jgi:uncharacterized protein YeaO (DUF488 family)